MGSIFFFGLDDDFLDDKGFNSFGVDMFFVIRGESIVDKDGGFGVDDDVDPTVGESPADVFGVYFVELSLSMIKFHFSFSL